MGGGGQDAHPSPSPPPRGLAAGPSCPANPTASWTLEELSKVVKMPVALLRRRLAVWLQQGVLREEPAGTFSVVEEERPQDRDSMVLLDSDEDSDSGMASQADQKEEELLVRRGGGVCWAGGGARPTGAGPERSLLTAAVSPALLDVHPGHADQPGEPVAGAHLQHAAHVRGDGPRAGRD